MKGFRSKVGEEGRRFRGFWGVIFLVLGRRDLRGLESRFKLEIRCRGLERVGFWLVMKVRG